MRIAARRSSGVSSCGVISTGPGPSGKNVEVGGDELGVPRRLRDQLHAGQMAELEDSPVGSQAPDRSRWLQWRCRSRRAVPPAKGGPRLGPRSSPRARPLDWPRARVPPGRRSPLCSPCSVERSPAYLPSVAALMGANRSIRRRSGCTRLGTRRPEEPALQRVARLRHLRGLTRSGAGRAHRTTGRHPARRSGAGFRPRPAACSATRSETWSSKKVLFRTRSRQARRAGGE